MRDQQSQMLHGLTVLELCLLVAMVHATEATEEECFNFEMVYNGACPLQAAHQLGGSL